MANPTGLSALFNTPPDWAAPLLAAIGDGDFVDPAFVLERIKPFFDEYENLTRPRQFSRTTGKGARPVTSDFYVYCHGFQHRHFTYRIVRTTSHGHVQAMDVMRWMADAELFRPSAVLQYKRKREALADLSNRMEASLERGFEGIKRTLGQHARWVTDIRFLHTQASNSARGVAASHGAIADQMREAVADIVGDRPRMGDWLRTQFVEMLDRFAETRQADNDRIVARARAGLDENVMRIMAPNPSAQTLDNYNWLTRHKSPEWRQAAAAFCPVVLLTHGYQERLSQFEGLRHAPDDGRIVAEMFGAAPDRIAFYRGLTEAHVGADNVRDLPALARFAEKTGYARTTALDTPEAWGALANTIAASRDVSALLERTAEDVFVEYSRTPGLIHHDRRQRHMQLEDMRILKNRIVTFGLVPRLVVQARLAGFPLPVTHALYIASGTDLIDRSQAFQIPGKARQALDDIRSGGATGGTMINTILRDASLNALHRESHGYGTHMGEYDRHLRELIITNRLAEHGADYPWAPLPVVEMTDDGYTVIPLNSQADLFKNALHADNDYWRRAPEAIVDGTHFVALRRRGGFTDATAVIHEPAEEGGAWEVADITPSATGRRRNALRETVEAYLLTPEFLDTVDLRHIRQTRESLYRTLSSRANGNERIGLSDMRDMEERKMKLRMLAAHWPLAEDFDIDEFGCISTPLIDRLTRDAIGAIAPYYGVARKRSNDYGDLPPPG